jgi:hypothetical protein
MYGHVYWSAVDAAGDEVASGPFKLVTNNNTGMAIYRM